MRPYGRYRRWRSNGRAQAVVELRKHRIDFADLEPLFEGPVSDKADRRRAYGEARRIAVGRVGGVIVSVVYTWRGEARRIISARRANRHEREDFDRHTVEEIS